MRTARTSPHHNGMAARAAWVDTTPATQLDEAEQQRRRRIAAALHAPGPDSNLEKDWRDYEAANARARATYRYEQRADAPPPPGCRDCGTDELVSRGRCRPCLNELKRSEYAARKAKA